MAGEGREELTHLLADGRVAIYAHDFEPRMAQAKAHQLSPAVPVDAADGDPNRHCWWRFLPGGEYTASIPGTPSMLGDPATIRYASRYAGDTELAHRVRPRPAGDNAGATTAGPRCARR